MRKREEVKFHVEEGLVVFDEPITLRSGDTLVIGADSLHVLRSVELEQTIVRWIVENVDESVIPTDEGNGDALVYNLVHLAREGKDYRPYYYEREQDREIARGFDV